MMDSEQSKKACRTLTSAWIETILLTSNGDNEVSHSHECVD